MDELLPKLSDRRPGVKTRLHSDQLFSVVLISSGQLETDLSAARAISAYSETDFEYYELIIVASLPRREWQQAMSQLAQDLPHLRILVVGMPFSFDDLVNIGLDKAVGDYVVVTLAGEVEAEVFDALVKGITAGQADLVKAVHDASGIAFTQRAAARLTGWVIRVITGHDIESSPARAFALTSGAIERLRGLGGVLRFFRILDLGMWYRQVLVATGSKPRRGVLSSFGEKARITVDLISLSASRLLLTVALTCFFAAATSILAMLGAVGIKYLLQDVVRGWTSTVVLSSALFAANFAVLGTLCLGLLQLLRRGQAEVSDFMIQEVSGGDLFATESRLNIEVVNRAEAQKDAAAPEKSAGPDRV